MLQIRLLWIVGLICANAAAETVLVSTRDELIAAAHAAKPGTVIQLAPGRYAGGIWLEGLKGTLREPITIMAADANDEPVIEGGNENVHLAGPSHVKLANLIFTGAKHNALNIDDGGSMQGTAGHVTLYGLKVRDVKGEGNCDGIKLSGLSDFTVDGCEIENWGAGGSGIDMVGCRDGVIRRSLLKHRGPGAAASGIQCKGGSRDVLIEKCRLENAGRRGVNIGGSTGLKWFRPQPPPGYEAKDITVRECVFIGSNAPLAFVGCEGALVERNTIYRPRRWVFRILQETRAEGFVPCRSGVFCKNLVVWHAGDLHRFANVGEHTAPKTFRFEENWWYCLDKPEQSTPSLPTPEIGGVVGRDPKLDITTMRLEPGSPAAGVGADGRDAENRNAGERE